MLFLFLFFFTFIYSCVLSSVFYTMNKWMGNPTPRQLAPSRGGRSWPPSDAAFYGPHESLCIMIIQTFWSDFSSHCGILANIGYQDWSNYVRRRRYVVCSSDDLVCDGFKQAAAIRPIAVVSIIRYPGKHVQHRYKSLLSLFGPPSLLANDKYFKNSFPFRK